MPMAPVTLVEGSAAEVVAERVDLALELVLRPGELQLLVVERVERVVVGHHPEARVVDEDPLAGCRDLAIAAGITERAVDPVLGPGVHTAVVDPAAVRGVRHRADI